MAEYIKKKDIILPKRRESSHKGDNGRVLIVAGSKEYPGAAALAGIAALRSGADIVIVATPEKAAWAINSVYPDLITVKLDGEHITKKHLKKIIGLSEKSDSVLIGSGIGKEKATSKFVKAFLRAVKKPAVVDADAINVIGIKDLKNGVMTPHKGEYERLLSNSKTDQRHIRKSLGRDVILLKGRIDEIITSKKIHYNRTGNAGMTVGGTGDVLAGLCAGFIAQGLTLEQAAIDAAYFAGRAGDILKAKKRYTFIASDVADEIGRIRKHRFKV